MRPLVLALVGLVFLPTSAAGTVIRESFSDCACDPSSGLESTVGLLVQAAPGEANRVSVQSVSRGILVRDSGARIVGRACRRISDHERLCGGEYEDGVQVELGDLDDSVRVETINVFVDGGAGADLLEAGPGGVIGVSYEMRSESVTVRLNGLPDDGAIGEGDDIRGRVGTIEGGSGDDVLQAGPDASYIIGAGGEDAITGGEAPDQILGGEGNDAIDAAGGNDWLDGGPGADVLGGGAGRDEARYEGVDPLHVSIGDGPNDGAADEGDDVLADIEDLRGALGDDVLVGSDGPNRLDGGTGTDTLLGGAGADRLSDGGNGDLLDPGPGRDRVATHASAHVRLADGEPDRVGCGKTAPQIEADGLDTVAKCAPSTHLAALRGPDRNGRMTIVLTCEQPSAVPCSGRVQVRRNGRKASRLVPFGPIEPRRLGTVSLRIEGGRLRPGDCLGLLSVTRRRDVPSQTRVLERNQVCRATPRAALGG